MFSFGSKPAPPANREVLDELDAIKRRVRALELEWESTYNKIRAVLARMNKRDERAADAAEELEKPEGFPPAPLMNRTVRRLRGF